MGEGDMAYDCITISAFADEAHLQHAVAQSNYPRKKAERRKRGKVSRYDEDEDDNCEL